MTWPRRRSAQLAWLLGPFRNVDGSKPGCSQPHRIETLPTFVKTAVKTDKLIKVEEHLP
jgi:hypothetical protein